MIESPEYLQIDGEGELFAGEFNLKVVFQVFLINQDSVIYCQMNHPPVLSIKIDYSNDWSLKGITSDNQYIHATNLLITQLNEDFVELVSNNNIIIGEYFDFTADKVIYPLANLFDVNFEVIVDDFKISVKSERNSIKKNISKYWGIPQISGELILDKSTSPIESFTEMMNHVLRLLSLGTGRHLAINLQTFHSGSKNYTLLQNNFTSSNHIPSLLLSSDLPELLKNGIPILKTWDMDKFKDLRTIQIYLNSTDTGYVDDRILNLVQCYEIIAQKWITPDYEMTPELIGLKQRLKATVKDWRNEFPKYDPKGFWSGRLHNALEWEKTVKLLENVLKSQNLNIDKLDVDFTKLVELRHAVAHTGRFGSVDAIKDLVNGQFALRLFLLKTFKFNGKVREYRGSGWSEFRDISEYETLASA